MIDIPRVIVLRKRRYQAELDNWNATVKSHSVLLAQHMLSNSPEYQLIVNIEKWMQWYQHKYWNAAEPDNFSDADRQMLWQEHFDNQTGV